MAEPLHIDWDGISDKEYRYSIYPIDTQFKQKPGNYIFAKETKPHNWLPIYIGQTDNLDERFENHHKKDCIRRKGASAIHVHLSSDDETIRCAEEQDLIKKWLPPCND